MDKNRLDHDHRPGSGRLRAYPLLERRAGERLHPLFENTFRRAKKLDGSRRMDRFLRIDRSR